MANELSPFIPRLVSTFHGDSTSLPEQVNVHGCVMFADLSGFTTLVQRLYESNTGSAEQIQSFLNAIFTPLVECVHDMGGDVIAFPGDAALAVWTSKDESTISLQAHLAAHAALRIQEIIGKVDAVESHKLRLRIVISCGALSLLNVGDSRNSQYFLVDGLPISRLQALIDEAHPAEVLLDSDCAKHVLGIAQVSPRSLGFVLHTCQKAELQPSIHEPAAPEQVRAFVPQTVRSFHQVGQLDWIAEFRHVTTMFVNVDQPADGERHADDIQRITLVIQNAVEKFGGAINQIVVDDKGLVILICFGVADFVHEDDPSRAVYTGLEIHRNLADAGVDCRIGITSGNIFVGKRGSSDRHELALIGHPVNLAARLMNASEDILCDATTRSIARQRFYFEKPSPIRLKGIMEDVNVFRPRGIRNTSFGNESILGREAECAKIDDLLQDLDRDARGGLLVIKGGPGIGKSKLMNYTIERAHTASVKMLHSAADSIESRTPYFAFRRIIRDLLGTTSSSTAEFIGAQLHDLFGNEATDNGAFLSPMLPVNLPASEKVDNLEPLGRANATCEVMLDLISKKVPDRKLLILIEDIHWLDEASAYLLQAILRKMPSVLVIVSRRSTSDMNLDVPSETVTSEIEVKELNQEDSTALLCRTLDVDSVTNDIAEYVYERSGGQPLFTEQLARALRNHNSIVIKDGACLVKDTTELENLEIPYDITGVITGTIDTLELDQQLILKIASVIGLEFRKELLNQVLEQETQVNGLDAHLEEIEHKGILSKADGKYRFKHALIQLAVYNILPSDQSAKIHSRVGLMLEEQFAHDPSKICTLLAHHFENGDEHARAIKYLEMAGNIALTRDYANNDAVDFLQRLVGLTDHVSSMTKREKLKIPGSSTTDTVSARIANWNRLLGDALIRKGNAVAAAEHLQKALRLLGQPFPLSKLKIVYLVFSGLARRMIIMPRYPTLKATSNLQKDAIEATVAAYERYVRICYVQGKSLEGIACSLMALPLSEHLGPSYEYCNEYSMMSNVIAVTGRLRLADRYQKLAAKVADDIGDRTAEGHANSRAILYRMQILDQSIRPQLKLAISNFRETGNYHEESMACLALARVELLNGNFAESEKIYVNARDAAIKGDSRGPLTWSWAALGELMFRKGEFDEADRYCAEAAELTGASDRIDYGTLFQNEGTRALIALRKNQPIDAWKHAEQAILGHDNGGWLTFSASSGYMGVFEVLLYSLDGNLPEIPDAHKLIRRILRKASIHKSRRVILPLYYYYGARRKIQQENLQSASKLLEKGIALSRQMEMPYELALMLRQAGQMADTAEEGNQYLQEASKLFHEIDARDEVRKCLQN